MSTLCRCTVPHYWDATTPCAGPAATVDEARAASLARLQASLEDPIGMDLDANERRLPEEVLTYPVERPDLDLMIAFLRVLVHGMRPGDAIDDLPTAPHNQTGDEPTVTEVQAAQRGHQLRLDAARIDRIAAGTEPGVEQPPPISDNQAEHAARVLVGGHDPAACPWCVQELAPVPDRDADPVLAALPEDTPEALRDAFARRDIGAVLDHLGAHFCSTCDDCRDARRAGESHPCARHMKGHL